LTTDPESNRRALAQRLDETAPIDSAECEGFELRSPDSDLLRKTYHHLNSPGQDLLRVWTWLFLSFNRVPVSKRQAILESVEMKSNVQLLLPKGLD
jgi:hypothetical protein